MLWECYDDNIWADQIERDNIAHILLDCLINYKYDITSDWLKEAYLGVDWLKEACLGVNWTRKAYVGVDWPNEAYVGADWPKEAYVGALSHIIDWMRSRPIILSCWWLDVRCYGSQHYSFVLSARHPDMASGDAPSVRDQLADGSHSDPELDDAKLSGPR